MTKSHIMYAFLIFAFVGTMLYTLIIGSGYGTMTVTEITSNDWNIDVYGCEVNE